MAIVNLDKAVLKRSDTYKFDVKVTDSTFSTTDTLRWYASRKITDVNPVIEKTTTNGGIVRISDTEAQIIINPEDTSGLTKTTTLIWEFERTSTDGEVDTLILPSGKTVGTIVIEVDLIKN